MIDTHCHLTYDPLLSQLDAVLRRAADAGVDRMITVGTRPADAQQAATLASKHANIYATVGLHPHYCAEHKDQVALITALQQIATMPKVVALGEMGLDRHYNDPPIEQQRKAFAWQLGLAAEMSLPVIIHNREATAETVAMIRDSGVPGERFLFHCFTGSDAELDTILPLGSMVSFAGIVTFKNAASLAESSKRVPLERVLIETDAPYLTPAPHRKVKVNEPAYVRHTAEFLAQQRGMSVEDFTRVTDANAERFFRLPPKGAQP